MGVIRSKRKEKQVNSEIPENVTIQEPDGSFKVISGQEWFDENNGGEDENP